MPYQAATRRLVAGTARLGDDAVHVLDLRLGTAEGVQLPRVSGHPGRAVSDNSYLFLGELARALVLAVAEQFDDAALIGSEAVEAILVPTQSVLSAIGKTYPATSLTSSRTKAVRLLRWPLVRLTRGLLTRAVVFCTRGKSRHKSARVHHPRICFDVSPRG